MKLTIPYYLHKAGAGFPSPATDYIEEDIDLNVHLIKNVPATFVIRVQGKSMTDVGVNDGDILVVDKSLNHHSHRHVLDPHNSSGTPKLGFLLSQSPNER